MRIVISANSAWNLFNFRLGLMDALRASGHEVIALVPLDKYVERLRDLEFTVIPIKMDGKGKNPIKEISVFFQYFRILQRVRPHAFLGFTIKPNIYGSIACSILKIPVINNIAGLGISYGRNNWLSHIASVLYKYSLRHSHIVFFQNEDDRLLFGELGLVDLKRTKRLPGSGVDLKKFDVVAGLPCSFSQEVHFLLVARMLWEKGVEEFVSAARIIRSVHPNVRFSLLGFLDVSNPSAISNAQMKSWEEEGAVRYLGVTDNVKEVISKVDCVVLPSYYREGVPRSLLEASAMARPVITTDSVGCKDVVDHGINGFICRPRDSIDLTRKIEMFLRMSTDDRIQMGRRGRTKVELEFDEQIIIAAYKAVLVDIAQGSGGLR
jgi:glycosyltransferase involved in cell wall biosynthesis